MFSQAQITKGALIRYYQRISGYLLPHVINRPVTLVQCPDGVDSDKFFRKHAPTYFPSYIKRTSVPRSHDSGPDVVMATVDEEADLTYLANQNVVEFHVTTALVDHLQCPDQLVFDLDPVLDEFERVRACAFALKEILDRLRVPSFVKTSGRNGLHVHVPVLPSMTYEELKPWVEVIGRRLCERVPMITTTEHLRSKRGHAVYVDTTRNNYSQTIVAPYSVRATAGATVSTPIDWSELKRRRVNGSSWSVSNMFRRLAAKADPWRDMRAVAIPPETLLDRTVRRSSRV